MELERIREVIAGQMNVPAESITRETSFANDLEADSLDVFQIVAELEEIFDLEFSNDDAERIKTVGDVLDYIKSATE